MADRMQFADVLIRQAHPSSAVPPCSSFEQKMRHAEAWQREENIPYPVLADDVPGAVHHTDGGMADSTYLIDSDGRVSSYSVWTHAPTLYRAIMALLAEMGRGVVLGATTVCRIWPQR